MAELTTNCDEGYCDDLPHVIGNIDPDSSSYFDVWAILENHAEFAKAQPALEKMAASDGYAGIEVRAAPRKGGAEFGAQIEQELADFEADSVIFQIGVMRPDGEPTQSREEAATVLAAVEPEWTLDQPVDEALGVWLAVLTPAAAHAVIRDGYYTNESAAGSVTVEMP